MPTLLPPPKFRELTASATGPLIGGTVEVYQAGTSTPIATFADSTGAIANPWPVVLDSQGRADIWIAESQAVKIAVKDSGGSIQYTVDNVIGVGATSEGPGAAAESEWLLQADTPVYLSANTFSVDGNHVDVYQVGRRVEAQVAGGPVYGTIATSGFATGVTTVTLTLDGAPMNSGLTTVAVGILSTTNPSASVDAIVGLGALTTISAGMVILYGNATPPAGYLTCDGLSYAVATYPGLHAVIGDTYGGDGGTNFNVPDLRGRAPVHFGSAPDTGEGGTPGTFRSFAAKFGAEAHTLSSAEMPPHVHSYERRTGGSGGPTQQGAATLAAVTWELPNTGSAGSGAAHTIQSPALAMSYIIKT